MLACSCIRIENQGYEVRAPFLNDFTLNRLKEMAERRNVGYQTLLKTFVLERLYEEEKREGALAAGQTQEKRISDKSGQE